MYSCVSEDASGKEADGFGCGNESELAGYGPGFLIHCNSTHTKMVNNKQKHITKELWWSLNQKETLDT